MLPKLQRFNSFDGCEIVYRHFSAPTDLQQTGRWVVIFHRGHEHSARQSELAMQFTSRGYQVFAWDARGNGESQGERDSAASFSVLVHDAQLFISHLAQRESLALENLAVIGNSIGALIATAWVHDYAPKIRALIIAAPAFRIKLYLPFAIPLLRFARKLGLMSRVTSYVKAKVLTHDRTEQQTFNQDPLISHGIATDLLIDTYDIGSRLIDDAGAITVPVLVLCAGSDWVVQSAVQRKFYQRLGSPWKEWQYYADFYHAIFHEDHRQQAFDRSVDFIERTFATPIATPNHLQADQHGYSKDLQDNLALFGFRPNFYLTRVAFKYLGHLSAGISIAQSHGFDSGSSLDYVYQNQPRGTTILGRAIDKNYLNSPGWVGIRERKQGLDDFLDQYSAKLSSHSSQLQILDIACGNGRYIIDFLQRHSAQPVDNAVQINVELRDYMSINLEKAQQSAEKQELHEQLSYRQCDAFSANSYREAELFDLVVISGLLELESNNQTVLTALSGAYQQLKPGGYLIYTNQPWHPQLEFIAQVLHNHQGEPWLMRPRSQAEIDALVEHVGLQKVDMWIDTQGIFSIAVAQKSL